MGKMGDAANLGAVAIAAFIVYKLAGLKLPKLELPKIFGAPAAPIFNIDLQRISEYRTISETARTELDEHVTNLENIRAAQPYVFPTIPKLDIKPPVYYESKLETHRAKLEHYEDVSSVLIPGIEAQLAALQTGVTELRSMVGGNSTGGSTDMVDTRRLRR